MEAIVPSLAFIPSAISPFSDISAQVTGKFRGSHNPYDRGCSKNCMYALCSPKKPRYMHYQMKVIPLDLSLVPPPQQYPSSRPTTSHRPPPQEVHSSPRRTGGGDPRAPAGPVYEEVPDKTNSLPRSTVQHNVSVVGKFLCNNNISTLEISIV